jgi:GNAT superfamily N-acetyltransferase
MRSLSLVLHLRIQQRAQRQSTMVAYADSMYSDQRFAGAEPTKNTTSTRSCFREAGASAAQAAPRPQVRSSFCLTPSLAVVAEIDDEESDEAETVDCFSESSSWTSSESSDTASAAVLPQCWCATGSSSSSSSRAAAAFTPKAPSAASPLTEDELAAFVNLVVGKGLHVMKHHRGHGRGSRCISYHPGTHVLRWEGKRGPRELSLARVQGVTRSKTVVHLQLSKGGVLGLEPKTERQAANLTLMLRSLCRPASPRAL